MVLSLNQNHKSYKPEPQKPTAEFPRNLAEWNFSLDKFTESQFKRMKRVGIKKLTRKVIQAVLLNI